MKRYVSLEDISDGHLYTSEDLVKAGCGGLQRLFRLLQKHG